MLIQALNALSASTVSSFNICISDNSSTTQLKMSAKSVAHRFECLFRESHNVSVSRHYHEIFTDLNYDFITILHDDDLVMPGFVESILFEIQQDHRFSVLGFNAIMFQTKSHPYKSLAKTLTSSVPMLLSDNNIVLCNPFDVLFHWVSPFCTGIVPVSGLTFNTSLYQESFFEFYDQGCLYFDTLLVLLFSEVAPVKWYSQATLLMIRVHDLRLTEAAGFSDAMSFANAVAKRYKNSWKISLILGYFLAARKLPNLFRKNLKERTSSYFRYCGLLTACYFVWPVKFVRLMLGRLSRLISNFN